MAKHLCHIQVERTNTIALLESKVSIACTLTYHIQWGAFTLSNLTHVLNVLLVDEKTHALLTLVGNDFLAREGLVANRQLGHIDETTTFFHQLRQAVHVTC